LGEPKRWQERLKFLALKRSVNVAVSRALAQTLPVEAHLIPNAYEKDDFCRFRNEPKTRDIVFVGRLVSDKGVDLLVRALSALKSSGLKPSLTIVGEGPERSALQDLSVQLGVNDRVYFAGRVEGELRGEPVGSHRIMAIPSRWAEPFGIVALEGIAAGCALVGSRNGGLPEAIGPCGLLFKNGDAEELAAQLRRLLIDASLVRDLTNQGPTFLEAFEPQAVIATYIALFRNSFHGSCPTAEAYD
jgi:glycosyltransferase involved in cell wall biosynthesis